MRDHYDFSKMKGKRNPYVKYLKQPVTIRLDKETISYFKELAEDTGIPYQRLINLYLRDCAVHHRTLEMRMEINISMVNTRNFCYTCT